MSLTKIFAIGAGTMGALGGAIGALAFGLPGEAVAVTSAGAAAGATSASLIASGVTSSFNGKGSEAGVMGLFVFAAAHVAAVPIVSVCSAHAALKFTGFIP